MRTCWTLLLSLGCSLALSPATAAEYAPAQAAVYFSPAGGATAAVVAAIQAAKQQILLQAYRFTSAPIAKALVEAHQRGVQVSAILDKSNITAQYSTATFLRNAGITPLIDAEHAMAHNKVLVIDQTVLITGSFNFSKAAEESNAANLLVLRAAPALVAASTAHVRAHAAHARPSAGTTAAPPRAAASPEAAGPIRAHRRSTVYRLPSCKGYRGMTSAAVVGWASEEAAQQAGYRRAKDCQA